MAEEETAKKYEFKSEEDRQLAISELPEDAPIGVDVTQWQSEQNAELEEIMNTPLLGEEEPAQDENPEATPVATEPTVETPAEPSESEKLIAHMQEQQRTMEANYAAKYKSAEEDFKRQIEELKSTNTPPAPSVPEPTDSSTKIEEAKNKISQLQKEMKDIEDQDAVFDNNDYISKSQQIQQLALEVTNLQSQEVSKLYSTVNEMKEAALKESQERQAEAERAQANAAAKAQQDAANQKMEEFRNKHEELKGSKSYASMEEEFMAFGQQAAAAYFGKPPNEVSNQELELAMLKYKEQTPALLDKLAASGVKAPDTYQQYDTLFNVKMALQGRKLNPQTGAWDEMVNEMGQKVNLASFEDAYNYINRVNGSIEQQNLAAQQQAVQQFSDASQRRSPVTELSSEHQRQDVDDLTKEEASNIVMAADDEEMVMLKRQNPNHPKVQHYEKAAAALGYDPIPV